MQTILMGIFFLLHGMVHLLYAGQSWRLFELRSEMTWPDSSWASSKLLGDPTTRLLATVFLVLAALGLALSGLGLFFRTDWWRSVVIGSTVFSSILFFVLWDGKFHALADQGGLGSRQTT